MIQRNDVNYFNRIRHFMLRLEAMKDIVLDGIKLCECGCGKQLEKSKRFIHGHNWKWKKRKFMSSKLSDEGYVMIYEPNYPYGKNDGWVKEHRLVWETHNNAILCKWTDIHHLNHIKTDNRIENLQPLIHGQHTALHKMRRVLPISGT